MQTNEADKKSKEKAAIKDTVQVSNPAKMTVQAQPGLSKEPMFVP